MWQGPFIAKPPLLLHRLLITVDKHAGGDPPLPNTHTLLSSIHTNWDLRDMLPPGNSGSARSRNLSSHPRFQIDKVIRRKVKSRRADYSALAVPLKIFLFDYRIKKCDTRTDVAPFKPQGLQSWWQQAEMLSTASFFLFHFMCPDSWKHSFCKQQLKKQQLGLIWKWFAPLKGWIINVC